MSSLRFARRAALDEGVSADDPLSGIANLFDVSVAFILAVLVALFTATAAGDLVDPASSYTLTRHDAAGQLEIVRKEKTQITVQKVDATTLSGEGERLGTAYRLGDGRVVYVPDGGKKPQ
jgi:hypothetical protein